MSPLRERVSGTDERLLLGLTVLSSATVLLLLLLAGLLSAFAPPFAVRSGYAAAAIGLGVALGLAISQWPELLVYLTLLTVILDQWERFDLEWIPYLTLSKLLMALAAALLAIRYVLKREKSPALLFPSAALAHFPFSLICLISALAFAYSPLGALRWLMAPLFLPILSILLVQFIRDRDTALQLLKAFALFSFFPIAVAAVESVLGRTFGGPAEIVFYGVQDIFRVAGTFENPNDFVVLMIFSIPLLFLWAYQTSSWTVRIALLLGAMFQGLVLMKTYSRSGYLSVGLTLFALVFFARGRLRRYALGACVLGACAMLLLPDVRDRLLTLAGIRSGEVGLAQAFASISYRKLLLLAAWSEFLEHPILGIGFSNLGPRARTYSTLIHQITAENTYVQILAELGIVGFAAYLFFLGTAWNRMMAGLRAVRGDRRVEPLFVGLAAGYCGFAFNSLFDTNIPDNMPWVLLAIMVHLSPKILPTECATSPTSSAS